MLTGLYSAATGLSTAEATQEVLAHNLAHVNMPGYRRRVLEQAPFEELLQQSLELNPSVQGYGSQTGEIKIDFTAGAIERTGRTLDAAIDGDGFFVVDGPGGPLYTRNGVFQINSEGTLVTSDGRTVAGANGPITFPPNVAVSKIVIGTDGSVSVGANRVGELQLATFEDPQQLEAVGTTLFRAPAGVAPTADPVRIQQGAREQSNVAVTEELVRMLINMRQYEAAQRAVKALSESIGQNTDPRAG